MTATVEKFREVEIVAGIRIKVPEAPWSERERLAWYWAETMKPSEWAERYRVIDGRSAVPGPWKNSTAPYLRGIMDIAVKRGVERLVVKKATQMGVSEATRNLIGFWAHLSPAPMGLTLPNKVKGEQIVENDLLPFFRNDFGHHPELKHLLTSRMHDLKKGQIKLNNSFVMYLMWSGSPTSLASNPMKRAISDETNKFDPWSGNDADPISLIDDRLGTHGDKLHLLVSSPTDAAGVISQEFTDCPTKFYFLVACPHCRVWQRLMFGDTPPGKGLGVKWSDQVRILHKAGRKKEAAELVRHGPEHCWYECANEKCRGKITEREKRQIARDGKWGTVGEDNVFGDGRVKDAEAIEEFPPGTAIGMQLPALYGMWEGKTLAHVAAEFLKIQTQQQLFHFRTSTLGEDWEQVEKKVDAGQLAAMAKDAPKHGVIPKWAARLLATVDTQKDHFYAVIRAWGPGMRSRRIWHGRVPSFEAVEQWTRKTPFANEDPRLPARICDEVYIDSGGTRHKEEGADHESGPGVSRVMQVYAWVLKNRAWARALKGDAEPKAGVFIRQGRGTFVSGATKIPLPLLLFAVHHFQDQLVSLMETMLEVVDPKTGEVTGQKERAWEINDQEDQDYSHHMANMQRVLEGTGPEMKWVWRPLRDGVRVDYRMCEVYQTAAAYVSGVHLLGDMPAYLQALEADLSAEAREKGQPREKVKFQTPHGQAFVATRRER